MSNVLPFRARPAEADRFPDFEMDPDAPYNEVSTFYVSDRLRLALLVERHTEPSPLYLLLHRGDGSHARCLGIWTPETAAHISNDEIVRLGLAVARALAHVEGLPST